MDGSQGRSGRGKTEGSHDTSMMAVFHKLGKTVWDNLAQQESVVLAYESTDFDF
jgi:hypothetical protein